MRAAVYGRYGPPEVIEIKDVPKPLPKDNEVLVRVHATTVSAADWRFRRADPFLIRFINGLWRPKKVHVLGMEFAGEIEGRGKNVTRFAVGDLVFGGTGIKFGAHAEYICISENGNITLKPVNMSSDEAAAVIFGGCSALHFLEQTNIQPGQKVLVYGASGSVGVFAVQLAKYFRAHVTAVCGASNMELVKSLGADEVVDYTKEDFSRAGRLYDVVFDAVGKSGFSRSLKSLKRGGCYVQVGGSGKIFSIIGGMVRRVFVEKTGAARVLRGMARGTPEKQNFLKQLIEAGKLKTVIERRYTLNEIAEAHRHAEGGHKKGHVVVVIEPSSG